MANDRFEKNLQEDGGPSVPQDQSFREVEMRRWPHPVRPLREEEDLAGALHYIHCTLAYQNQLLADMKALLQTIARETESGFDKK